jgi:hypothetical protein
MSATVDLHEENLFSPFENQDLEQSISARFEKQVCKFKTRFVTLTYSALNREAHWRQHDLTLAVFLAKPKDGHARVYRTRDLGRFSPDGCLYSLERKDSHIKIRVEATPRTLDGGQSSRVRRND